LHDGGSAFCLPLLGRHNLLNALYAIQIGRHFQLSEEEIQRALATAEITGMRLEVAEGKQGMLIINDAYNASPTSMHAALELLQTLEPEREKWVLLGDMREIGPEEEHYHREIGAKACEIGAARILTVGERGAWIAAGAEVVADTDSVVQHFASVAEASSYLTEHAKQNVLLLVKASQAMRLNQAVHNLR
jgi:UDP-N-acetylmuramoyl-tripeptide--D-alanyl-D-alanine ligase